MIALKEIASMSFDQFIDWHPENATKKYELKRGTVVEMPKPRGKHSEIAGFVIKQLNNTIDQMELPYFIPRECILKISDDTGYEPDVAIIDRTNLANEFQWENSSIIANGAAIKLVVEVVSTNWRDDYLTKLGDYEAFGIQEYWIIDYLAIGGRRYIGSPKQPTLTVCNLVDGEYELQQLRENDPILSPTLPALQLTVNQVFNSGELRE